MSIRSEEYWNKRSEAVLSAELKKAEDIVDELYLAYNQALEEIEKDIARWYARYATEDGITLQEAKKILAARELNELKLTVEKYIKYGRDNEISEALIKQLERASVRAHISRLEAIQLQIIHEMNKLSYMTENKLTEVIKDVYKGSYYNTGYEIAIGTGIGVSFSKINTKQLETIMKTPWAVDGKTFSQRIWGNNDKVIEELKQGLTRSIIQGTSPSKTIQSIQKIFKTSQSNAERLVMTESSFFASKAIHDSYKSTGVERYQILATLDHRTSEICRDMDGKVFRMSDYEPGVSAPPFHARCRTTTIPYFDDNYGKRIAKDNNGKTIYVDSKMTYRDWEKKFVK